MTKKKKKPTPKMQAWIIARNRHHLSNAQVQMARELGMNPKRLGKKDNHDQEPWKIPLKQYIEHLYIKRFGKPDYLREVLSHAPLAGPEKPGRRTVVEDSDELTDPMYDQAARLVIETRKASASYIQRRLHLGYTRSARLLDMMEKEGLVGPLNGSKGREVLVPPDYFEEVDETHGLYDETPSDES